LGQVGEFGQKGENKPFTPQTSSLKKRKKRGKGKQGCKKKKNADQPKMIGGPKKAGLLCQKDFWKRNLAPKKRWRQGGKETRCEDGEERLQGLQGRIRGGHCRKVGAERGW